MTAIYPHFGAPPLFVECPEGLFTPRTIWYENLIYAKETYRGLDDHEDVCSIGSYSLMLRPGEKKYIIFTLDKTQLNQSWGKAYQKEKARIQGLLKNEFIPSSKGLTEEQHQFYRDLVIAGNQFIVRRESNEGKSIIAGYHWFTDWGRDTMIAMRGLVIAGHQDELARNIIRTFLLYLKDGLIPNRFPDQGEIPEYNTIDASLWLFIVLYEFQLKFNDKEFIAECLPKLREILLAYRNGTHFNIHMLDNGLIYGGEKLSQLTWMDAKVGDYVVTPRQGCPVEINALWYNALCIMVEFEKLCKIVDDGWHQLSMKVKKSFHKYFLNNEGYLNDVIIPGEYADDAFRSNQVYALSLPFGMLNEAESKIILQLITEKLLTPYGLRTLSMDHPDFVSVYKGDQWHRDSAYHQGTVWAYLMGEYLLAFLRINKHSKKAKKHVLNQMDALKEHFYHHDCIHGISEIFDGADPKDGKGDVFIRRGQ